MDPLSIASGVIAVLTASGKTLEGLEKIRQLRHRDQGFLDLWNSIALKHLQESSENSQSIHDCLSNVNRLCLQAISTFATLDKLIQEIKPQTSQKSTLSKPAKIKWIRRNSKLVRMTTQVTNILQSLATTLHSLQGVQHSTIAAQTSTRLDLLLSQVDLLNEGAHRTLCDHSSYMSPNRRIQSLATESVNSGEEVAKQGPYLLETQSSRASTESFHTATSKDESSNICVKPSTTLGSSGSTLFADAACERFCQCKCHLSRYMHTPQWARQLIGSLTFHGNGSVMFSRRTCDRPYCRRNGPSRIQISYIAPTWKFLKAFTMTLKAEITGGIPRSFWVSMPRVISYKAGILTLIKLGRVDEIKRELTGGWASPYDVTPRGQSLLRKAAGYGQMEIYSLLLTQNADPYLRDDFGMMAIQPCVDYYFTTSSCDDRLRYDQYITDDMLDAQDFTDLHLVILGLLQLDLETILKYLRTNVDLSDATGRTPLLWAAWRGDLESVTLLVKYGADVDKADNQGYTPLAKATSAGHIHVVETLLEAHASNHIANHEGHLPIHLASSDKTYGHCIIKSLLARGADPNVVALNSHLSTPLHYAAASGNVDSMMVLLSNGADIDAASQSTGYTAAMVALSVWHEQAFQYLANSHARLDAENIFGENILQMAVACASDESWKIITEQAERDQLGFINLKARHARHEIEQCLKLAVANGIWAIGETDWLRG